MPYHVIIAVHPRERGEQASLANPRTAGSGSSPRARGTGVLEHANYARVRFIPASAGNRPGVNPNSVMFTVHPRERGEQDVLIWVAETPHGSSPRARGTVSRRTAVYVQRRFIPASAGNREAEAFEEGFRHGSSPRARGTAAVQPGQVPRFRFIPASAGNRTWICMGKREAPVHPRERGEQSCSTTR